MSWPNWIVKEKLIFQAGDQVSNYPGRVNDPIELRTGYSFWDWLRNFLNKFTWIVLSVEQTG